MGVGMGWGACQFPGGEAVGGHFDGGFVEAAKAEREEEEEGGGGEGDEEGILEEEGEVKGSTVGVNPGSEVVVGFRGTSHVAKLEKWCSRLALGLRFDRRKALFQSFRGDDMKSRLMS